MKTKKLLSILLALMMMLSVVPMYASAATALKASNVVTWPTISYKTADGKMYYGQTQEEALIINDDEVVQDANGNIVDGHFEFNNPTQIPSAGTRKSTITFVPDDTSMYTGFKKSFSSVTYVVEAVTPSYVDEKNDPVVASEVEQGALLSTSILSGGAMTNPHNPNEPNLLETKWIWSNKNAPSTTVVNESGYYEAQFAAAGYEAVTTEVYVEVIGTAVATTITEVPTVADMTYGATRNDIVLEGGKVMAGDTEVAGTFTLDYTDDTVMNVGTYNLAITFTPDDTENYLPSTGTATVTVNPAPIKFVDENGAECVPEITVPYGTTFSSGDNICIALKSKLNVASGIASYVYVLDDEGNILDNKTVAPVGTKEYKVIARTDNKNYEEAVLTFNLTVEPIVIEITGAGYSSATNELYAYVGKTNIPGTFDIFVDGGLVGDDLALTYDTVTCPWTPTETGEHTIKVVYNAVNENYVIADYEKAFTAKVQRTLTYDGYIMLSVGFRENATTAVMGDLVTIKPVLEDFAVWVITDANSNEVALEGVDLTAKEITFTMPDHDVKISFKTNTQLEQEEAAANCDHICHSDNPLFQMLWKVLSFIFRLFDVQQYCDCGNLHYDAPLFG